MNPSRATTAATPQTAQHTVPALRMRSTIEVEGTGGPSTGGVGGRGRHAWTGGLRSAHGWAASSCAATRSEQVLAPERRDELHADRAARPRSSAAAARSPAGR